jgi:hypothetical protein
VCAKRLNINFETVSWNKEIKRTAKKTKFQTTTCAQHETPKLNAKHMENQKYEKKLMKKYVVSYGTTAMTRARPRPGRGPGPARARASPGSA